VTRIEVEDIRGVACGDMIRTLMEKGLVRITGRSEKLGRPLLYGTTKKFLQAFGLGSLKDLPDAKQLVEP
jgi:segregation and condensation protein B